MQSTAGNGNEVQNTRTEGDPYPKIAQYGSNQLGGNIPCTGPNQHTPGGDCYSSGLAYCRGCRVRRINALIAMEKWERFCENMFNQDRIQIVH
jgi:hypothetical protein